MYLFYGFIFSYFFRKSPKIILELKETKALLWWKIVFLHLSEFVQDIQFLFNRLIIQDLQEFDIIFLRAFN